MDQIYPKCLPRPVFKELPSRLLRRVSFQMMVERTPLSFAGRRSGPTAPRGAIAWTFVSTSRLG
jgi:hypothetical protein